MARSINEWCKSIDREIAYLRDSQEKAYSTLRNTTQKHHASLLGSDMARYYAEELDTLLNRTTSYYNHLIADLYRKKENSTSTRNSTGYNNLIGGNQYEVACVF